MPRKKVPEKPPRRRRNTGSIARQSDGTYWAIPPRWVDEGRKPRRGFRSWQEAGAWLDDACERARHQGDVPADITLGEYGLVWYERIADSAGWSHGTRLATKGRIKMLAPLRATKVADLKLGRAQDVIAALARRGVSAAVIGQVASVLRRILASAQEDGIVAGNVAARLVLPKVRRAQPRAWTHQEVRKLLDTVEGEPLEPLVLLGLVLGMRIGEILGLAWDEIDFDRNHLAVRQSYSAGQLGPPKTRRERTVTMPDRVWAALLRHREGQAPGTRWVFPSMRKHDHPISYQTAQKWLRSMVKAAGIRELGTHALRHTSATAMLSSGVLPSNAAQQLGHANPGVTLSTYWSPTDGDDPSAVVAAWLDGDDSDPAT